MLRSIRNLAKNAQLRRTTVTPLCSTVYTPRFNLSTVPPPKDGKTPVTEVPPVNTDVKPPTTASTGDIPKPKPIVPGQETNTNYRALWLFLLFGIGGLAYMKYKETNEVVKTKVKVYQVAGKLQIGGPFSGLIDQDNKPASSDQYIGAYPLIYFGFSHCPDICPTELRKMMRALDIIEKEAPDVYNLVKPIFISVDPLRDTVPKLKEYSKQYHPRIRWLTGPYERLLDVAKKFRVYFSIPDDVTADDDYNVDHSIFFFLMDKQGEMLNYYGQNMNADEIAKSMIGVVRENMSKM